MLGANKAWDIILLAITLMGQGGLVFVTYRLAIRQFRMAKASNYLERFMAKDMMDARAVVDNLCRMDVDKMVKSLRADDHHKKLSQVRMFANFFQELGIAFRKGLVDRNYTEDVFDFLVKKYWEMLHSWVQDCRKAEGDKSLYSKWEELATIFEHKALERKL